MLPKLDVPIYELKLISTGKTIRFRPFLVKEQKLLLMASESTELKDILNVVKQVIKNCILTEGIDVDNLPIFDLEYLFLSLRARSVGEIVELKYKCNNKIKDEKGEETSCSGLESFQVNLLEIEPKKIDGHDKKIMLTDKMGIVMKYPTFEMLEMMETKSAGDMILEMVMDCIDFIFDDDQVYYAKDTPKDELIEFIESMQQKDLDKIQNFFDTAPKLKKNLNFKCAKCGYKEDIVVEGLQSFFV